MKRRLMVLLGLLVVASLVLSACAPAPGGGAPAAEEPAAEAPAAAEQPSSGLGDLPRNETLIADILTGRVGSPDDFNNWVGWKWRDRGMQNLANEPLWSVDFATGEIINGLASGDPVYNDDFTQVTIPLREGVTWSDGEPFTSADVVFTVETLMAHEGFGDNTFFVENVKSVSAPDEYTVAFELNQPNSRFHTKFLDRWGCTWIMPKHIWESVEDPVTFKFNPFVGTGPYKLHSFDPSGFWTIWEKRADWDKSPTGMMFGEPKPTYIVFQNFADEGAKILAQLTHQADVLGVSSDGLQAVLQQCDTCRAYRRDWPYVVNNDPAQTGITFNTAKAPYDSKDVRWALLLAIDIADYMGIAVDGTGALSPVHIPSLSNYPDDFIKPMIPWLEEFTLDIGNGETFQPFDVNASQRIVEYAKGRGHEVSDDPAELGNLFGYGWYKYAPDVAEKLLVKNGFSKNADGKWLLPDGTPWQIACLSGTQAVNHDFRNCAAAVQAWKRFGIDASQYPSEANSSLNATGDFDVSGNWPAQEPWGAGPDLYRVLDWWNSGYIKPLGETTSGHPSRWSSPEMDAVIEKLRNTDPTDYQAVVDVGIEGLKIAIEEMPGIPTYGYVGFVTWDEQYWTNWPGAENPYTQPYTHWGPFKYMTPFLEPTGAE
ncbi:MAG: ABC transporter substrate-binding protein [Caldilinea sp.]|nr:ABC transporter substrate-binding protein [Caldilineaceae bacterium]MCB9120732.1 ABC transporter substrate-binding protein [Caldilineaceae bacterium]MCO5210131.1 ABC transporter substrate-binding protein [Caldilinea sp.]